MTAAPVLDVLEELVCTELIGTVAPTDDLQHLTGRALCGPPLLG